MSVIFTRRADLQLEALQTHYQLLGRENASSRLIRAVEFATMRIDKQDGPFLRAPRPYPRLARFGWVWLKQDRYWFAFRPIRSGFEVLGVFYDGANIPGRL